MSIIPIRDGMYKLQGIDKLPTDSNIIVIDNERYKINYYDTYTDSIIVTKIK